MFACYLNYIFAAEAYYPFHLRAGRMAYRQFSNLVPPIVFYESVPLLIFSYWQQYGGIAVISKIIVDYCEEIILTKGQCVSRHGLLLRTAKEAVAEEWGIADDEIVFVREGVCCGIALQYTDAIVPG